MTYDLLFIIHYLLTIIQSFNHYFLFPIIYPLIFKIKKKKKNNLII